MQLIMSLVGMATLILIAVLFSSNRRAIRLRTVGGAFLIQIGLGAFVLYSDSGREVLLAISDGVKNVIDYGNNGMSFLFAGLVSDKMFELFGGGRFCIRPTRTACYRIFLFTNSSTVLPWYYASCH
ncbi:Na+ dependent nucleoside transporter [Proteus vulgaris]|nr:Na+ dependent nucleoside transporter [Proteus vulgaris]